MNKFLILVIAMMSINTHRNVWGRGWAGAQVQGPELSSYPAYWNWNNYHNNNWYQYVGPWGVDNWNPDYMWTTTNQNLDNTNLFNGNNGSYNWGADWEQVDASPLLVGTGA